MSKRFTETGGREAVVDSIPGCDMCALQGQAKPAAYDGATVMGPWAYMCEAHFRQYGVGVGEGRGQRLFTTDI